MACDTVASDAALTLREEVTMIARALLVALALVGPAQAQSLAELYVQSEQARLDELRIEIRRIEGRIRTIKESAVRPPDPDRDR